MESYPKFHNAVGVPIVRIGCREFTCIADSDDVARLKRDNAAQGFLDDAAHRNEMMSPGSRASLADVFVSPATVSGQALTVCFVRVRRMLSPSSSMRWAL